MTRSPWSIAAERARGTGRARWNRFTGFISEPGGRFVSQRICVRIRHTAIQNPVKNGACGRTRTVFAQARVRPSDLAYARRSGRNPARTSCANSSGSSQAAKCPPLPTSLK
ncbi:hypothetical protein DF156_30270 [Burkholderia ubonensis]|uniref:Uncharacterized protein n=1 Tax=Burkholderia ubonensis TaxID=101571 RepID=A0AB74CZW8_9BURK|nr:hypothetical protein CJO71_17390 [Burkholderia ubonensis]PAK02339.1 hypothetical protein CJO68_04495 [Burkholderia ubonensis]PAK12350.1 hypothetical protein CJO66_23155 [Burkholderia ubonensis]RQP27905.1 hypothetical protein DF155_30055 [Burkholderia ubonensis]RQP31155.1 hypothetical protein DF154_29835 [Burkholderia ubonensis]